MMTIDKVREIVANADYAEDGYCIKEYYTDNDIQSLIDHGMITGNSWRKYMHSKNIMNRPEYENADRYEQDYMAWKQCRICPYRHNCEVWHDEDLRMAAEDCEYEDRYQSER